MSESAGLAIKGGSLLYLFANAEEFGVYVAAFVSIGHLLIELVKLISTEWLKWRQDNRKE